MNLAEAKEYAKKNIHNRPQTEGRLAGKIAKDEEQATVREAIEELRKKQEAAQLPSNQERQTDEPVNPDARS